MVEKPLLSINMERTDAADTNDAENQASNEHSDGSNNDATTPVSPSGSCWQKKCHSIKAFVEKWKCKIIISLAGVLIATVLVTLAVMLHSCYTNSRPDETVSQARYENGARSSWILSSSICFNNAMWHACSGENLNNSSMQLLCSFLTCSFRVDQMAASKEKYYEQICKSVHNSGVKGMDYVCHTCLGYNSSNHNVADIMANECLFKPAILQRNDTLDENSAWLVLRSNDPELWLKSSNCLSSDVLQRLDHKSSRYLEKKLENKSFDFIRPICKQEKQCSDIISLPTSDAGEGPPSDCNPGVLSRAANNSCISTEDWLENWLRCCPK